MVAGSKALSQRKERIKEGRNERETIKEKKGLGIFSWYYNQIFSLFQYEFCNS